MSKDTKDMVDKLQKEMRTYTQQEVDSIKWNYDNLIKDLTDNKGSDYILSLKGIIGRLQKRCQQHKDNYTALEAKVEAKQDTINELKSLIVAITHRDRPDGLYE